MLVFYRTQIDLLDPEKSPFQFSVFSPTLQWRLLDFPSDVLSQLLERVCKLGNQASQGNFASFTMLYIMHQNGELIPFYACDKV